MKDDPFADTPDWNSVASEEINSTPLTVNPFSDFNTLQQPASASHDRTVNPFADVALANNNISNDLVTNSSNPDLFSQYISNIVATRDNLSNTK